MKRLVVILCLLALAGVLFWWFPLFHVVRLDELRNQELESQFDAAEFAERFWKDRLIPSLDSKAASGVELSELLANPTATPESVSRRFGISRTRLVQLRGDGRIVSVDKKGVGVVLGEKSGNEPDVVLHTGLVFGNVARDASGLLNAADFPHSQNFNDVSTELNRIIEQRVAQPLSEQAKLGGRVEFVGCAELLDVAKEIRPLKVIPLRVNVEPPQ